MKVPFLDIDGVLDSVRSATAFGGYPMELEHIGAFDPIAIRLIQRLCDASGAQVVLSSAWRTFVDFRAVGEAFGLPVIGETPLLLGQRGDEIYAWLCEHPQVEQYAIVDDNDDMLPGQMPRFVQTCGFDGLRWGDYVRLCELFGVDPEAGEPRDRDWRGAPASGRADG